MRVDNWRDTLISPDVSITDAMLQLDKVALRILIVVQELDQLIGVITDGDIRRGLLKKISFEDPISKIMSTKPLAATMNLSPDSIRNLLTKHSLLAIPVINGERQVIGLESFSSQIASSQVDYDVVIMAGGFGKRLLPLTQKLPKPMLPLGSKPILENIIEQFIVQGFKNFYISTHYKAKIIEDYFGSGERFGVSINYLQENIPLGTAGALGFLKNKVKNTFLVMNADLVTNMNFKNLIDFHHHQQAIATMCVRENTFQVPYGVVEIVNSSIQAIQEKPIYSHFVNVGVYCLNPEIFQYIDLDTYLDMPSLFQNLISAGDCVKAFPLYEDWLDIGRMDDYQKALSSATE